MSLSSPELLALAAVLAVSASLGFARLRSLRTRTPELAARADCEPLLRLFRTAFPVWERQLTTVRAHGSEAASALVHQFQGIVGRLEAALDRSREPAAGLADSRDIVAAVAGTRDQLAQIVRSLEEARRSKEEMLSRLGSYTTDLGAMAAEVRQIALQITLLSLNATIEAARAGAAGRSFSVVVQEMRQLSARAGETGARMTRQVQSMTGSVAQMQREAQEQSSSSAQSLRTAGDSVGRALETSATLAAQLGSQVAHMQEEADAVRAMVADALVSLQFEDRISQVVGHVVDDVRRMREACESGAFREASLTWLAQMASAYSTPEEFANLEGTARARAGAPGQVTFFT